MTNGNIQKRMEDSVAAIVTHVYATGPAQELEDYLKFKTKKLIFIGHPFKFSYDLSSFYKIYEKNSIPIERKSGAYKVPDLLMYLKDIFLTLFWIYKARCNIDIYIGFDPLNALAGVILKKLGKVKKVIFYMIDYAPKRFNNRLLNQVYHKIDSLCVKESDSVWNLSSRMSIEREKKGIVKKNHQLVVPIGVNFSRIKRLEEAEINRMNFVYMGHVKRNQGIELIVESFGDIVKEFPQARLTIIGGGDLEPLIREKVNQGGLSSCVEFKGFVPSHEEVEKMLASCGIGLALYEPNPESVTWYTDPSKPKQYMACGLPVIITVVPQIAEEVNSKNLGLVVDYERRSFVNAALRLLKDKDFYFTCRRNAIKFASGMQWELIFESAFSKSL